MIRFQLAVSTKQGFFNSIKGNTIIFNSLTIVYGYVNLDTGFNADVSDLLHNSGWGVEVNQTLVNPHFETIPCVRSLTGRSLTGGNPQNLGRHSDWAGNVQILVDSPFLEVGADLFKVGDVTRSQRDTNTVHNFFLGRSDVLLDGGNVCHGDEK